MRWGSAGWPLAARARGSGRAGTRRPWAARPLDDAAGDLAARAQLKGFAFEYMTSGEAVVLGDPGPWLCAGMTGGVVFVCTWPELGLDAAAVRRLARGASVTLEPVGDHEVSRIRDLLHEYRTELWRAGQAAEADAVAAIGAAAAERFVAISPAIREVDQSVNSE